MSSLDIEVTAGPADWILVEAALSGVLSQRYQHLADATAGSWDAEVIEDGIRPLERVRHAILEAVYPEPEPEDGIDMARREEDLDDEWTNREGMPEFNGAFR